MGKICIEGDADVDWYTGRIKYYKEKWGLHTPKWMSALAGRFKRKPEENK